MQIVITLDSSTDAAQIAALAGVLASTNVLTQPAAPAPTEGTAGGAGTSPSATAGA